MEKPNEYDLHIINNDSYKYNKKTSSNNFSNITYHSLLYYKKNQQSIENNLDILSYQYYKIDHVINELKNKITNIKNKIFEELKKTKENSYKNQYVTIRLNKGYINNILKPEIKNDLLSNNPDYFNITKVNEHLIIKTNKQTRNLQ